jgi:hypothetical protein
MQQRIDADRRQRLQIELLQVRPAIGFMITWNW